MSCITNTATTNTVNPAASHTSQGQVRSDRGPEIQLVGPERKLGGSSAGAEAELWGSTAGADLVPAALQAGFLVPAVGNWLASDGYLQEEAGVRKTEKMANEVAGALVICTAVTTCCRME